MYGLIFLHPRFNPGFEELCHEIQQFRRDTAEKRSYVSFLRFQVHIFNAEFILTLKTKDYVEIYIFTLHLGAFEKYITPVRGEGIEPERENA